MDELNTTYLAPLHRHVVSLLTVFIFVFVGVRVFADNRLFLMLYLVGVFSVTIGLLAFRRKRLPATKAYRNVRATGVRNPLASVRLLLIPEFQCEASSDLELRGIKRYGRHGMYQVSFHLQYDRETITVNVDCNGAFPDYLFVVHNIFSIVGSALRSCGYLQERAGNVD